MEEKEVKQFFTFMACVPLALTLALFAACGPAAGTSSAENAQTEAQTEPETVPELLPEPSSPAVEAETKPQTQPETKPQTQPQTTPEAKPETTPEQPAVVPLALLDEVDIPVAFGDDGTEDWSFSLGAEGNFETSYTLQYISEITGKERFYTKLGADLSWEDAIGLRAEPQSALGFSLFGGGSVGVRGSLVAPSSTSGERAIDCNAGFVHDGFNLKLIGSADVLPQDAEEGSTDAFLLGELGKFLTERGVFRTFMDTAEAIPEGLREGELRLAVEKLVSLGFRAEISSEGGLFVRLTAGHAFYTDLLNDMLEEFLPEDWLPYIPRADVRYESTDFSITLAFDEEGIFEEYTVESDCSLQVSLEIRGLFVCSGTLAYGGTYTLRTV